jgi:hypothetical protein
MTSRIHNNYYVEIAPAFIKLIRPLLFLPSGDRAEGPIPTIHRSASAWRICSSRAGTPPARPRLRARWPPIARRPPGFARSRC